MNTKKPLHPGLELFKSLFEKAAARSHELPYMPTYYVPRNHFYAKARELNIGAPENIVSFFEWEESIGLPEFAHKLMKAEHKRLGTDFTAAEKAGWRLRKKMLNRGA